MKRVLLVAVLALAVLGAFLYVLGGTESGLRWLAARVAARLPEGSRLERIRGHLFGPIDIENARFAIAGQVVEIGHAHFEWTPSELLHTSVHLSRVDASDVRLLLAPTAASSGSAAPLPVSIQVDALAIDRFDIVPTPASEPVRIDRLTLAATLDAAGITVHSLDARGLGAHAQGEIAVGASTPLSARIAWDYSPPGLPAMVGELRAHGEGNAIAIEQSLDAPWNLGFQGTLDAHARRVQGRLSTDGLTLDALRRTGWRSQFGVRPTLMARSMVRAPRSRERSRSATILPSTCARRWLPTANSSRSRARPCTRMTSPSRVRVIHRCANCSAAPHSRNCRSWST
jgi:autotransporter translocation and assembly factor TamB